MRLIACLTQAKVREMAHKVKESTDKPFGNQATLVQRAIAVQEFRT